MAKVCVFSDCVCVYIVIFLTLMVRHSALGRIFEKDIYVYKTDGAIFLEETDPTEFKLIDTIHNIYKRAAQQATLNSTTPMSSLTDSPQILTETETNLLERAHRKSSNTMNKVLASVTPNNTKAMPTKLYSRNFGENGSGIFWNVTTTTSTTPSLASPIRLANTVRKDNHTTDPDEDEDFTLDRLFDDIVQASFDKYVEDHDYIINKSDTHLYYNSSFTTSLDNGHDMWVDFSNSSQATTHDLLSMSHRRAATVKLSFEFPFYGHLIRNVTVATGGFIYTGDYVHSWLAATQYIAPLMANFDTSISNDSFVKYIDNSTAFTVQWENVALQDKPNDGQFTFQATLHKNGDIVFAYQNVPDIIKTIEDVYHPVTIGLSDAYIIDHSEDYVRRKTIFEYHKVSFRKESIKNWTVIYLTALPTCLAYDDCNSCVTSHINFKCTWCPAIRRCSIGIDRYRHEWLIRGCDKKQIRDESFCQSQPTSEINYNDVLLNDRPVSPSTVFASRSVNVKQAVQMGVSGVVAALFLGALIIAMGLWVIYAYRNPHTTSGQILIRYRPSQWRWRRGEARYTAATIHM